tara:strand:- start:1316 stop:3607 length:2292 start_codon:yes stop_codon:yes gene_type:complete
MAPTDSKKNRKSSKYSSKKSAKTEKNKKKSEDGPSDDESILSDDDENDMDAIEYRKFLAKLFPSEHAKKKVEAGEKLKKLLKETETEDEKEDEESESSDSDDEEVDDDDEKDKSKKKKKKDEKEKDLSKLSKKDSSEKLSKSKSSKSLASPTKKGSSGNFNIIFTVGGEDYDEDMEYDDDDEDWIDEDMDEYGTEDEDESVSSVSDSSDEESDEDSDEEDDEEEDDEEDEEEEEEEEEEASNTIVKSSKKSSTGKRYSQRLKEKSESKSNSKSVSKSKEEESSPTDSKSDEKTPAEVMKMLKDLVDNTKTKDKLLKESMEIGMSHYESNLKKTEKLKEKKEQKQKDKNGRIFKKLLRDKNQNNDFEFFSKLKKDKQIKIIKEVREVNKISRIETPYRISLLEAEIPHIFKSIALKKLNSLRYMEPGSGEFYKIKNWVDTFMRIPFNTFKTLPISIKDGVDKCHDFMENAQKTLDDAVYGLDDAKMQIMQMMGQLITNPAAIGSAIAIKGPMGTGKTTLVKEGISKILDRPFAFLALGGATDSSFLEGHSYTYEGSVWGKIVQILLDSKCMNPVIYFDELDKISDTPKGEEIAGILTHLTDTSQNSQFHDKYFSEIDFDLSKCLFIFSYNDESKVNPILRDRMYRIQTKGYEPKEKIVISNNHLIPKIQEQVLFTQEDILIPEETIKHIVEMYCDKEQGVRNLKRCLEIIYTKLNLYRLMKPDTNLFEKEMSLKVEFPYTVTSEIVDKLIKREPPNLSLMSMYI